MIHNVIYALLSFYEKKELISNNMKLWIFAHYFKSIAMFCCKYNSWSRIQPVFIKWLGLLVKCHVSRKAHNIYISNQVDCGREKVNRINQARYTCLFIAGDRIFRRQATWWTVLKDACSKEVAISKERLQFILVNYFISRNNRTRWFSRSSMIKR